MILRAFDEQSQNRIHHQIEPDTTIKTLSIPKSIMPDRQSRWIHEIDILSGLHFYHLSKFSKKENYRTMKRDLQRVVCTP